MTDLTQPVQTRDGRKARIVSTALSNDSYPVGAVIIDEDGSETFETFTAGGRYAATSFNDPRPQDLVNIPVERTVFAGLFGAPGHGGVKLGLWRSAPPTKHSHSSHGALTGILKLTYRDGEAFAAEIVHRAVAPNEFDPLGLG